MNVTVPYSYHRRALANAAIFGAAFSLCVTSFVGPVGKTVFAAVLFVLAVAVGLKILGGDSA